MNPKLKFEFDIEDLGFYRAAAASPKISLAAPNENAKIILEKIRKAEEAGCNLILFPQLVLSGATCGALFRQNHLLAETEAAFATILKETKNLEIICAIGRPLLYKNKLYSAVAVIFKGKIYAFVPCEPSKRLSSFFYDFEEDCTFIHYGKYSEEKIPFGKNIKFLVNYEKDQVCSYKEQDFSFGFDVSLDTDFVLQPLAEISYAFKSSAIKNKYKALSAEQKSSVIFANCGAGEDFSDYIFAGECGVFENGKTAAFSSLINTETFKLQSDSFVFTDIDTEIMQIQKYNRNASKKIYTEVNILAAKKKLACKKYLMKTVPQNPFLPDCDSIHKRFVYKSFFSEIVFLQASALAKRLSHIGCKKCVLGISGGLDSSLALLSGCYALKLLNIDCKNMCAVTMPGFGTTERTKNNALLLANFLGCTVLEISIEDAVCLHFQDIEHDINLKGITYENAQARERTQILMDKANQIGGIMIGSGDISEAALGWMTYGGDQMSMYELNSSIPKTMLKYCINAFTDNPIFFHNENEKNTLEKILKNIIDTPVSPELLPPENGNISQKTENIIGPYELHDFFIYHVAVNGFSPKKVYFLALEAFKNSSYSEKVILDWLKLFYNRFFSQQFKRSVSPEGASVTGFSFSPRGSWLMPSEASIKIWQNEIELLC